MMEIYYRFRGPNGSIDIASSPEEYSLLHCVSSHIELAHGLPICHNIKPHLGPFACFIFSFQFGFLVCFSP